MTHNNSKVYIVHCQIHIVLKNYISLSNIYFQFQIHLVEYTPFGGRNDSNFRNLTVNITELSHTDNMFIGYQISPEVDSAPVSIVLNQHSYYGNLKNSILYK